MARPRRAELIPPLEPVASPDAIHPPPGGTGSRGRVWAGVVALLALQYALAASSLLVENPTVDEIAHLPAGITYWQTGTFKLYHHNPPAHQAGGGLAGDSGRAGDCAVVSTQGVGG